MSQTGAALTCLLMRVWHDLAGLQYSSCVQIRAPATHLSHGNAHITMPHLNEPLSHALSSHGSMDGDSLLSGVVHPYAAKHAMAGITVPIGSNAGNAPAGKYDLEVEASNNNVHTAKQPIRTAGPDESYPSAAARAALFYATKEQLQEVPAEIHGSIPSWLSGSLVMNGGGDYSSMRHLFDGYGLLSKVRLAGGQAWGSQRFIDTQAYRMYRAQGHVVMNEFATPPATVSAYLQQALGPLGYVFSRRINPMTDNACVSIYSVGPTAAAATVQQRSSSSTCTAASGSSSSSSKTLALLAITEDQWGSYLIDPNTLQTTQQVQYPDRLPCIMMSPHPAVLSDGNLLNISCTFPFGGSHVYKQDRTTLKREEVALVPDRHWLAPAWLHDFAATDKYAVLIEHPLYLDFLAMLGGWDNNAAWMKWRPEEGTRIHLVTLQDSKPVQTFTGPAFCTIHVGNAYESEDGSMLHVDLGVYDSGNILNDLKLEVLRAGPESGHQVPCSQYMRLDIPLDIGGTLHLQGPLPLLSAAASQQVDFVDFFNTHAALKGRQYRYVYSTCAVQPTNIGNGLAKMDLATQQVKVWHEPGAVTGEPHFIAEPGAETAADVADSSKEDAGVVLSQCVDAKGFAFLLVLDAASWTELGRAVLPYSTPYRFHGVWLPSCLLPDNSQKQFV